MMVRLSDLHAAGQQSAVDLECPHFEDTPFVAAKPLSERTVTVISSAGLIQRGDAPFRRGDAGYRSFTADTPNDDILLSHISVNFDRLPALSDIELIFPRDTLLQMADDNEIGAAAGEHYSFMGATDPAEMEDSAVELAERLHQRGVDTAVLLPV